MRRMNRTLVTLLLLSCLPLSLSARKTVTRHFTGDNPAIVRDTFTYRGIPVQVYAHIIPPTKENGVDIVVLFSEVDGDPDCPKLMGNILILPELSNDLYSLKVGHPTRPRLIESECELDCVFPANMPSEECSKYIKMGNGVLARAKVKVNWKDLEKSVIKVTLKHTVVDES